MGREETNCPLNRLTCMSYAISGVFHQMFDPRDETHDETSGSRETLDVVHRTHCRYSI